MKQIIILIACLALAGCTKSFTEVEAARTKCTNIGGSLEVVGAWGNPENGVVRIQCKVGHIVYLEGKF